jgi:predicted ATPase with chaperone activity
VLLGELGLDGRVRPVRGILPATLAAQQAGFTRVIVAFMEQQAKRDALYRESREELKQKYEFGRMGGVA